MLSQTSGLPGISRLRGSSGLLAKPSLPMFQNLNASWPYSPRLSGYRSRTLSAVSPLIFPSMLVFRKVNRVQGIIERQAMKELEQGSLDLIDLVSDQVKRLGPYPTTKSAISMFGNIGHQTETSNITVSEKLRLQLQRPLKQSGLLPLLLETSGSLFQSAASSLIIWFWALLRWIWKVSNANKIILLLLILSLLVNGFQSWRDTMDWWQERNAGKFMARLGVRPNTVVGKAVYLKDLDNAVPKSIGIQGFNGSIWSVALYLKYRL